MKAPGWLDARAVIAGLAITAGAAACGAAVDVRDRQHATDARLERVEQVQTEREKLILYRLDDIRARLDRLEARP